VSTLDQRRSLWLAVVPALVISCSTLAAHTDQVQMKAQGQKPSRLPNPISLVAVSTEYSKWTNVKNASVSIRTGSNPILLNLIPVFGTADKPYRLRLDSPKGGVLNRWELRYLRDLNLPIALFAVGQTTPSHALNVDAPISLTALDSPPAGLHTYTLQIRYVGSQTVHDAPQLELRNALMSANSL